MSGASGEGNSGLGCCYRPVRLNWIVGLILIPFELCILTMALVARPRTGLAIASSAWAVCALATSANGLLRRRVCFGQDGLIATNHLRRFVRWRDVGRVDLGRVRLPGRGAPYFSVPRVVDKNGRRTRLTGLAGRDATAMAPVLAMLRQVGKAQGFLVDAIPLDFPTSMRLPQQQVTDAIVLWSGRDRDARPAENDELVIHMFGPRLGRTMIAEVRRLATEFGETRARHPTNDTAIAEFRECNPHLSELTLETLAWCCTNANTTVTRARDGLQASTFWSNPDREPVPHPLAQR